MLTERLDPKKDAGAIKRAAELLRRGEVVGMPTETVYGLAADAMRPDAVDAIFKAKGRPQDNPLIVHIASLESLPLLWEHTPPEALALAGRFWPGPLTIVCKKTGRVPRETAGGLDTVGVRFPSHPLAKALIEESGLVLAAPSANLSGRPSTTTAEHVMEDLSGKIAAVLDGGPCSVGVESTVLSLAGERPRLLRPGGVTLESLRAVLGEVEIDRAVREQIGDGETVSAPGMKYRHYAPHAPVTVVAGAPDETAAYIKRRAGEKTGILCFDEYAPLFVGLTVRLLGPVSDTGAQAQKVFDALRSFDQTDCAAILAQCPPDSGLGLAVANRLKKAAGFKLVHPGEGCL